MLPAHERGNVALRVGGDLRGVGVLVRSGSRTSPMPSARASGYGSMARSRVMGASGVTVPSPLPLRSAGCAPVDGIIVPGIRRVVGEARVLRGGQLEEL